MRILRTTFIINEQGIITHVIVLKKPFPTTQTVVGNGFLLERTKRR